MCRVRVADSDVVSSEYLEPQQASGEKYFNLRHVDFGLI